MARAPVTKTSTTKVLPIVLAGPTASGKSALAVAVAERIGGEIVCGDSRQLFAAMRIASAAPTDDDRARVPHHGFLDVDPLRPMNAADFIVRCDAFVDDVLARGKVPIIVGGSGLYLRAWRHGLHDAPPSDPAVRARLDEEVRRLGAPALHARLAAQDKEAAAAIRANDPVRVVRALEILEVAGELPSALRTSHGRHDDDGAVRRDAVWLLLDAAMDWLTPRLNIRARAMFDDGIVAEASALRARLPTGHRLLDTMGINEALQVADGLLQVDEAVRRTAQRQRQYARRQRTWFKGERWWTRLDPTAFHLTETVTRTCFQGARAAGISPPMRPLVETFVQDLAPYIAGKPIEETEREYGVTNIAKLASNENCLGPSPKALAAAQRALSSMHLYPDAGGHFLKLRLAQRHEAHGVRPDMIALGNGTNELIQLIVRSLCCEGEAVMNGWPSFVVYRLAVQSRGRVEVAVPLTPDHRYDLDGMIKALEASSAPVKVAFVANPNNPTGRHIGRDELDRFVARLPDDVVLVLDEAYAEYVTVPDYPDGIGYVARRPRTVSLRTFSKIFGLAGLRIGYAVGDAAVIDALNRVRDPFNTGAIAQAAALAALDDDEHVQRSRAHNDAELPRLAAGLTARGFQVTPSAANFVLAEVPAHTTVPELNVELLRRGVIIRPVSNYGLPRCVRVTVGTVAEDDRLFAAIDDAFAQQKTKEGPRA